MSKSNKKPATAEYCLDKVIADEMDWIIEIMSEDNPSMPFVSHDKEEEAKFKRKMLKAANRIKKWYTPPNKDWD
jgi:hypothetical protein